jgi:hypothetical protein
MLRLFGSSDCPHCATQLVQHDLSDEWSTTTNRVTQDPHLLCPQCGFTRPVVYAVERTTRPLRQLRV